MSRPEHIAPPEIYYSPEEAKKYTTNSSIIRIQQRITRRAIELLNLPKNKPALLLDVGCGSGLSGTILEEIPNSTWIGVDISQSMLDVARERRFKGDLLRNDIGEALPFRPNTFNGVISISAIQWLFNADFKDANPVNRIHLFFESLNYCLVNGGKVVLQFYLETKQYQTLLSAAQQEGFHGGLLCDYPNSSRQRKFFLVLSAGCSRAGVSHVIMRSEGEEGENDGDCSDSDGDNDNDNGNSDVDCSDDKNETIHFEWKKQKRTKSEMVSSKTRVKERKNRMRRKGIFTKPDTKYTGRRRSGKFD